MLTLNPNDDYKTSLKEYKKTLGLNNMNGHNQC